jgi:protein subunit release factor B
MHVKRNDDTAKSKGAAAKHGFQPGTIIEKFIRSGGKGGQHVNKTSTCVQLIHVPSGILVKVRSERSQARNREEAYRLLAEKVAAAARNERERAAYEREKERRRKRPRPSRLKERILESKKRLGQKKQMRTKRIEF